MRIALAALAAMGCGGGAGTVGTQSDPSTTDGGSDNVTPDWALHPSVSCRYTNPAGFGDEHYGYIVVQCGQMQPDFPHSGVQFDGETCDINHIPSHPCADGTPCTAVFTCVDGNSTTSLNAQCSLTTGALLPPAPGGMFGQMVCETLH